MKFCVAFAIVLASAAGSAETVRGTLVDSSGKALAGVRLTGYAVTQIEKHYVIADFRVVTGADGRFALEKAPSLPMTKAPVILMATLPDGQFGPVRLEAEDGLAVWSPGPKATLTVRAIGEDGKPLAKVKATLADALIFDRSKPIDAGAPRYFASLRGSGPSVATDEQGFARFPGIPVGARANYTVAYDGLLPGGSAVIIAAGGVAQTVTMSRGVIVSGRVLRAGKPVAGVEVAANSLAGHTMRSTRAKTDADGQYRIANAYPGSITLSADLGKLGEDWIAIGPESVNLGGGQERNGLNLVLDRGLVMTGQVLTKVAGRPVPNARINVSSNVGADYERTTDSQGRFSVRVSPGQWYVAASEVDGTRLNGQVYVFATLDSAHNPPLELRVPDAALLPPIAHLGGTVTGADGKPVGEATVRNLVTRATAKTDAEGRYRFDASTGPGDLLVAEKGATMSSRARAPMDKSTVDLSLDSKATTLEGAITDHDGRPLAGVEVTLGGQLDKGSVNVPGTKTDAAGKYRFAGLYGGLDEFFLWANKDGYGPITIQPIRTSPGEQKVLETQKMELADGTIDGQVLGTDGRPAAAVIVSSQVQGIPDVLTDSDGRFHLAGVPRGKHFIVARRSNSGGAGADGMTGQTDVVIRLRPEAKPIPGVVSGDRTGVVAPEIKIAAWTNNGPVDLKTLKGKIVVIDLWAVWCGPCVASLPDVQKLSVKYASRGVTVIGIHAPGTPKDKVVKFVKDKGLTYPVAMDIAEDSGVGVTAKAFGLSGIPHMLVIDTKGHIVADTSDVADVGKALQKLLGD